MYPSGNITTGAGKNLLVKLAVLLCFIMANALSAQTEDSAGVRTEQGYALGGEDIVVVSVLDEPELSGEFQVSSEGNISYPFLGNIGASGMTVEELILYITKRLGEDYLVNPVVTVRIKEYRSKKIFIQGEVVEPGVYYLKDKEKAGVLNLLLEAGGTTENASEEIVILRSGNDNDGDSGEVEGLEQIKVNLKDLLSGDQSQNIGVRSGDIIYIANASGGQFKTEGRFINIYGEVKKPGNYDYRLGLTVLNAILQAGGFTEYAAKNKVKILKKVGDKQKTIIAKLDNLIKKGKLEENILLDPGDIIVVPQSLF